MVIKRQICVGLGTHFTLVSGEGTRRKKFFFLFSCFCNAHSVFFPVERRVGSGGPRGRAHIKKLKQSFPPFSALIASKTLCH